MIDQLKRVITKAVEKYVYYEDGIPPEFDDKTEVGVIRFQDAMGQTYKIIITQDVAMLREIK